GSGGGEIVCVGTPEEVARCERSYTGQALGSVLNQRLTAARRGARDGATPVKHLPAPKRENNGAITHLTVQGANQHNLKNLTVSLPREQMTVFCGPSGSGK